MRNLFCLLLLFSSISAYCQWDMDRETDFSQKYKKKVRKFEHMRATGTSLVIFGAAGLLGGVALVKSAADQIDLNNNSYNNNTNSTDAEYSKLEGGVILATAGGAMLITGIVLSAVGSKKAYFYKQKLNMGFRYDSKFKGLCIAYKF